MNEKTYFQVSGTIFSIVAIIHALRLLSNFEVNFAGWSVPVWASLVGVLVAGYLSYSAFKLVK